MRIITYCGKNYKECLDITLPTWKADDIVVYSDTDEFGIKMFEPSTDFNISCQRKIKIIQRALNDFTGNILYLDTDVIMRDRVDEVFEKSEDIIATRMVRRERRMPEDINAGIIFWKANERTRKFCEEWRKLEPQHRTHKYPEQHAFNILAIKGYDQQAPWTVSNISENIYNFERDRDEEFKQDLKIYRPKLIHLKTKRWAKPDSLQAIYDL